MTQGPLVALAAGGGRMQADRAERWSRARWRELVASGLVSETWSPSFPWRTPGGRTVTASRLLGYVLTDDGWRQIVTPEDCAEAARIIETKPARKIERLRVTMRGGKVREIEQRTR